MKAIETIYDGYRFRSRLEARWAVVFNHLGIKYEYEKEGYMVGDIPRPYLPDFYLPDTKTWVEVKGDIDSIDWDLMVDCMSLECGLPEINHPESGKAGLLILGGIPKNKMTVFPILLMDELIEKVCQVGLSLLIYEDGPYIFENEFISTFGDKEIDPAFEHKKNVLEMVLADQPILVPSFLKTSRYAMRLPDITELLCEDTEAAYKKARQARFEHEEVGK